MGRIRARIDGGIVVELTEDDPEGRFHPALTWVDASVGVTIGMHFAAGIFVAAPPPVIEPPGAVAAFKLRWVLRHRPGGGAGKSLFDDVDAFAVADGGILRDVWEYAPDYTRSGVVAGCLSETFHLAAGDIDAMFVAASSIRE